MESTPILTDWFSSLTLAPTLATDSRFYTPNVPASFPAEIFHQIVSYLPLPESDPSRLAKKVLLSFSLTCRFFRDFFRNDVYSVIAITSPESLTGIVEYLNAHTWPGQSTAIKSLTFRWLQGTRLRGNKSSTITGSSACHNISRDITLNLKILLQTHTSSLEELTLDFPNSGIHFQNAIIDGRGIPAHQHLRLKRLHISNGLFPSSPPANFLLCAISSLCARSLEDLFIHGGCSDLGDSWMNTSEFCPNKLHVPGVLMFRRFEELQKLRCLHVKNLEGFDEGCLSWMLSGEEMQSSSGRKRNRVLTLGSNPDLTENGISNTLGSVKGGLEELDITVLQKEEPPPGKNDPAAMSAAWCTEETTESDTTLSDDSMTDTTYEEGGHHSNSSFIARASGHCYCGTASHSSSGTCHQHHQEDQYASSIQSTSNLHLCAAARACHRLRRLDTRMQVICHSSSNFLPGHDHRGGSNNMRFSPASTCPPSPPFEDVAENDNPSIKTASSLPFFELSPTLNPRPTTPDSPRLIRVSSDPTPSTDWEHKVLEVVASDVPDSRPGSLNKAGQDMTTSLRGGGRESKRLLKLADKTLSRVVGVFAKLRGLWKSKKSGGRKKERSKCRKRASNEPAEV